MKERLSIVVPVLNEAPTLAELVSRLRAALSGVPKLELIFVDDASTDGTFATLRSLAHAEPRIRAFRLGENIGSQQAILLGLERARGDVAVCLDGDLQQPPEAIPRMLEAWQGGASVVHMVRTGRSDEPLVRSLATRAFYSAFNLIGRVRITPDAADFKLLDRSAVDQLISSRPLFLRAAAHALSGNHVTLSYQAAPRRHGRSRYTVSRLIRAGVEAFATQRLPTKLQPTAAVPQIIDTIP